MGIDGLSVRRPTAMRDPQPGTGLHDGFQGCHQTAGRPARDNTCARRPIVSKRLAIRNDNDRAAAEGLLQRGPQMMCVRLS